MALNDLIWHQEEDQIADKKSKDYIKAKHNNSRFAEKVLKYLWDDTFKFNHPDVFITSKDGRDVNSLEVLVECFSSVRGNKRFDIFEDTIKEALLEALPKADSENDNGQGTGNDRFRSIASDQVNVDIDGGTVEHSSGEQTMDVDGGGVSDSGVD